LALVVHQKMMLVQAKEMRVQIPYLALLHLLEGVLVGEVAALMALVVMVVQEVALVLVRLLEALVTHQAQAQAKVITEVQQVALVQIIMDAVVVVALEQ
jgi:hypothetical protein